MNPWEIVFERLTALEQMAAAANVTGKVTDVDAARGLYRQTIGKDQDGQDVKSPWIPYSQHAGALKAHIPPSIGQQMVLLSNGTMESGVGIPLSWSDSNPSPHNAGNEHRITFRGVTIDFTDGLKVTIGGTIFEFTSAGFKQTGGRMEHDGKNVGKDHRHDGIVPGGAPTGLPQP